MTGGCVCCLPYIIQHLFICNNKGPGKFQIVKVWKVQSDEIDQFNQRVVNMIKAIEGFVERDTLTIWNLPGPLLLLINSFT